MAGRADSNQGARRFLLDLRTRPDRRATGERRSVERRSRSEDVSPERRDGSDRRNSGERRSAERRMPFTEQFSFDDSQLIQAMIIGTKQTVACPSCQGNLLVGPPEMHDQIALREVHCTSCRRNTAVVADLFVE